MISVLILTKNEESNLPGCLKSVAWCDDINVFDSYSEDSTIEVAQQAGAIVTQRKFDNWSDHQNWGLANIRFKYPWVLYIDADERVSESLYLELKRFDPDKNTDVVAYEIQRRDFAWNGKWLKRSQISPYYVRLFRPEKMRYERLVNPISLADGKVMRMNGYLDHYPFSKGFNHWFTRHLGYANMEAEMLVHDVKADTQFSLKKAIFERDFTERRYHQKGFFYRTPLRPVVKWLYMVIWRKGFMDGATGITYATLQAIYEYLIVLRTREITAAEKVV
ncbi:glycosyltransferase family 2 protein [Mucilaginibacter calamicampi]|uniref:Glycosyltransferase family 2 protein n=1 Tax=Mucilaginibacter calamicampi TaxID=1302352 RepID=A0ABW2Z1Z2_9SPHI